MPVDSEHIERLIEDSDSVYHARVTKIQLDNRRQIQEISDEIDAECVREIEAHLDRNAYEFINLYTEEKAKRLLALRAATNLRIDAERIARKARSIQILNLQDAPAAALLDS